MGVAVFALRRGDADHDTRVLLLKRSAGSFRDRWAPVAGHLERGESESAAALRELAEETSLAPSALYALPLFVENVDAALGAVGRIGVFVALVASASTVALDTEHSEFAWLRFDEARARLSLPTQTAALDAVREGFVRRPPDEALRVA